MTQQVATQEATVLAPLVLTPPETVTPVVAAQVPGVVPLKDETKVKLDEQRRTFVAALLSEDVRSDEFRQKLDSAFSLGRKEIAAATTLSNDFTKQNFVGQTDTAAYAAVSQMRELFDDMNPAKQGDLFAAPTVLGVPIPTRVLGVNLPFGNKLKAYLRRYESAETQFAKMSESIENAKTEVQRGVSTLGGVREKLWGALEKLESVVYFIKGLDSDLTSSIDALKMAQPDRARALEQEVLYYVRQNVGDVQAAQALTINAYNVAGELRKTGRETMNGCDRLNTLGMAALSVAVTMAKATGVQIRTQKMVAEGKKTIHDLIGATGDALQQHVQATTEFASDPIMGLQTLQSMFDKTNAAMDVMENFRSNALATMQTNNEMLGGLIADQMKRIGNDRKAGSVADVIAL